MASTLGIGEFARLTYLSVPALRHYHETGVLAAGERGPVHRLPSVRADQVATAHLVRRLRELQMSLPEIRSVVGAADEHRRDSLIAAHLERMEQQLVQTRSVIASLRGLLTRTAGQAPAEVRDFPRMAVLGVTDAIRWDDMGAWFEASFEELFAAVGARGIQPGRPSGRPVLARVLRATRGAGLGLRAAARRRGPRIRSRRRRSSASDGDSRHPVRRAAARGPVRRPRHHLWRRGSGRRRSAPRGRRAGARGLPDRSGQRCVEQADYRTEVCWPIEQPAFVTPSRTTPGGPE